MGYEERCKLLFQAVSGVQPRQQEQFWLILRSGTASGSKFFLLYSNSKVWFFSKKIIAKPLNDNPRIYTGFTTDHAALAAVFNSGRRG